MATSSTPATSAKHDAISAAMDRTRKKPRLSSASSSAATSSSSTTSSRLKSGLLPPAFGTSRLHYAFGSRLPLAGKENAAPANTPATTASGSAGGPHKSTKHADLSVKKPTSDAPTAERKRKPTRRSSDGSSVDEPSITTKTTSDKRADPTTTPPVRKTVSVVLSPVKPVRFAATSATDPDFWKCRQEFARSAMRQLKELETRLHALSESPSLPGL